MRQKSSRGRLIFEGEPCKNKVDKQEEFSVCSCCCGVTKTGISYATSQNKECVVGKNKRIKTKLE